MSDEEKKPYIDMHIQQNEAYTQGIGKKKKKEKKKGGAISKGIVSVTLIISGINSAVNVDDVTDTGILIVKLAMLILPLISIVAGFLVYRKYFKIDDKLFGKIVSELKERGDINA